MLGDSPEHIPWSPGFLDNVIETLPRSGVCPLLLLGWVNLIQKACFSKKKKPYFFLFIFLSFTFLPQIHVKAACVETSSPAMPPFGGVSYLILDTNHECEECREKTYTCKQCGKVFISHQCPRTHGNTHWKLILWMYSMWESLWFSQFIANPSENSHWRETLQMKSTWESFSFSRSCQIHERIHASKRLWI